jgi:RNA polymerase sigma-70 factor (ECF subfamily)
MPLSISSPRLVPVADEALAETCAAQHGDRDALSALYRRHQRAVFGFCMLSAGRDRERALDLTQETFARAFAGVNALGDPARIRPWLISIAGNVCKTRGGQDKRRRAALDALQLEVQCDDVDLFGDNDAFDRERRIATVQHVLAGVAKERLRTIAQLKYGDPEHTTREIAAKLSIPHGTVTVTLKRFRAAIRRELCRALAAEGVLK